jgi:hypothetical protein
VTPQSFSPFAVPGPPADAHTDQSERESVAWTLAELKQQLLWIAATYLESEHIQRTGRPSDGLGVAPTVLTGAQPDRAAAANVREVALAFFLDNFRAARDSERFQTAAFVRYRSHLSCELVDRIVADILAASVGVTSIWMAESLTLGKAADRIASLSGSKLPEGPQPRASETSRPPTVSESVCKAWTPRTNPVHRLIQLLDILRTSLDRAIRQATELPDSNDKSPTSNLKRTNELFAIAQPFQSLTSYLIRQFPTRSSMQLALGATAVSYFVQRGVPAAEVEPACYDAEGAICALCWQVKPVLRPIDHSEPETAQETFLRESAVFLRAWNARQQLIVALSRIGEIPPNEVTARQHLDCSDLAGELEKCFTVSDRNGESPPAETKPNAGTPPSQDQHEAKQETATINDEQKKKRRNKTHAESTNPERQARLNLYRILKLEDRKSPGLSKKKMADRLLQRRDVRELADKHGIRIDDDFIKAARQYDTDSTPGTE